MWPACKAIMVDGGRGNERQGNHFKETMENNVDIISQYRESKKQVEQLAIAAREQMQARYVALLTDAADIQAEFKASFGEMPTLPVGVKVFTPGAVEQKKPKQAKQPSPGMKIGGLRRSLAAAIKNHDAARVDEITKQLAALGIDTGMAPEPVDAVPDMPF